MNAHRSGVWIAMAAILVQAPRLVLAVLAADHQSIGAAWERGLLVVAGIGTATVLTGGNLYLAHAIGSARRRRRWLVGVWLLVLASTGGLVVPLIAAGLGSRTLPQLLGGTALTWTWSGLAALAHEVTAAGCVLAAAALGGDAAAAERQEPLLAQEQQLLRSRNGELVTQRDAARAALAALQRLQGEQLHGKQPSKEPQPHAEPLGGERQPSRQQPEELAQQQSWEQQRWLRQSEPQQGPALPQARSRRAPAAAAGRAAGPAGEPIACREGCGRQFDGVLAEIGHLRHCPVRLARQASRPGGGC
jgi:hypothetical protein